jgi:hypothetical protein
LQAQKRVNKSIIFLASHKKCHLTVKFTLFPHNLLNSECFYPTLKLSAWFPTHSSRVEATFYDKPILSITIWRRKSRANTVRFLSFFEDLTGGLLAEILHYIRHYTRSRGVNFITRVGLTSTNVLTTFLGCW